MRSWLPQTLYDAKPWVLIGTGTVLAIGATVWTVWRGLLLFAGATLQLRQDYRARSKWRREMPP